MHRHRRSRGVSLVEVLIAIALVAVVTGGAVTSMGLVASARLKRSASMIAGAVRIAYAHANAKSRPVRLVFDFEERMIVLEESTAGSMALKKKDATGGAAAATEAERAAIEEADAILKGPRAPRPSFQATKAFGWNLEEDRPGKQLEKGIRFLQIETAHQDDPLQTGRAYLYFWPGGQTERAAIQLLMSDSGKPDEGTVLTVLVSPLTGKAEIRKGAVNLPKPRDDDEESERQDSGF
ncbi:pilus assembly FimT family protein [Chondromyces apiculatus]|uniref:Prepilin-type cleavage/methylation domain protein n=1 Tax=Chondromyces apiculatus DSM 436 TaxID=1192034 RepID=A0A017T243_9BACT|nr:prepilin-type N-terminal cleavage/methylation domain-containing protein [Chondromyces apiculatus]EYF02920.1 prepilin-type cleavage/methylation domain protein [Chondromyces apiculatus DSM 436]